MRVAEADRTEHGCIAQDGDDERRGWCEAAMQIGNAAGTNLPFVEVGKDRGAQCRTARPHDLSDGAVGIVRPDAMRAHQRMNNAPTGARCVSAGDEGDTATGNQMDETEVCEARYGGADSAFNGATAVGDPCAVAGGKGRWGAVHGCERPASWKDQCRQVQIRVQAQRAEKRSGSAGPLPLRTTLQRRTSNFALLTSNLLRRGVDA